jgi:glucosamine 6-phosphate synthetase-like amidotransferase/phosphosugar isomerase protein
VRIDLRVIEGEYLQDLLDQPEALEDTLDALDVSQPILDLAQRLQIGFFQRIVLTGMGSSFHALHPLNLQLIDYGFTAIMVETSELIHYETRLFDPKTLLIAVSQSGESAEMVRLAEVNRKRSAIIAVTNTPESTLAQRATATVFTRAGREFSVSCKTYVSALIVLKWLVVGGHPPTFFGWSWAFFVRRRNGGADRERIRSLSRRRHEQCSLPAWSSRDVERGDVRRRLFWQS